MASGKSCKQLQTNNHYQISTNEQLTGAKAIFGSPLRLTVELPVFESIFEPGYIYYLFEPGGGSCHAPLKTLKMHIFQ